MRLSQAHFTIFDFETTGLYPYYGDGICEIGAIRVSPGKRRTSKFHRMVDPERPISRGAYAVNGITEEMVRGMPTIEKVLPQFLRFIKGSVLVAYNAGFDLGFLECALGRKKEVLDDYYIIDALSLARRLFGGAGRYNLGSVANFLGYASGPEHRAMADALMTWKVFEKELEILKSEGVESVEDVAKIRTRRVPAAAVVKDFKEKLIEEAIREQKRLNITYRSTWTNAVTTRTITPLEIRRGYDRSYLIAHCHLKNEERNFRLDGIIAAEAA